MKNNILVGITALH